MSTEGALAGLATFDNLNVEYENAYKDNSFKKACVTQLISLLPPGLRVLDVGCGTGIPVSAMLATAGFEVVGTDISPKMVKLAADRVKGSFAVADMLTYEPDGDFAGVLMIFCHLQLEYRDFWSAAYKFAKALQPGGFFALGQMPSDRYVAKEKLDTTGTYVVDDAPFMGEMLPTLMLSAEGQREFFRSMGFEVVWESIDLFQPKNEKCHPEEQQYIIVRRQGDKTVEEPKPTPKDI